MPPLRASARARPAPAPRRVKAAPSGPAPMPALGPDPAATMAVADGDRATRIQLLGELNRRAGNAATAQLVRGTAGGLQREPSDNPYDDGPGDAAPAPYTLVNARFTPHARLQDIANGGAALSAKDPKAVVQAVQTALLDVGYSLLRYKDDGKFGGETADAIAQFRSDRGIATGEGFDAAAMQALDKKAPAPGQIEQHYLDYARLFADGRLDVTLAIGYDEGQSQYDDLASARSWFKAQKLAKSGGAAPAIPEAPKLEGGEAVPAPDPDEITRKGVSVPETWSGTRSVTYPDASGARVTKDITVSVTLVPPGTGAKAAFAKGLNESEITLYSGHARRGIGPDFDADKSPYENFVIGVGSALHKSGRLQAAGAVAESHYVIDKKNDLEAMKAAGSWDAEKYRVWFFNACSSMAYFDELRGGLLPEKMDRHNLDLFGTTQSVPIAAGLTPVLANLEGILEAQTMEQIVQRMQTSMLDAFRKKLKELGRTDAQIEASAKEYAGGAFLREGAGDNQVAPSP